MKSVSHFFNLPTHARVKQQTKDVKHVPTPSVIVLKNLRKKLRVAVKKMEKTALERQQTLML